MGLPDFADGEALSGRTLCGDLDMRIDRDGIWYYDGSPIPRKEMVCLFASTLRRDRSGAYWLVTPAEIGRIEVEDAPFMAVEMFVAGNGPGQRITFRTNVDELVEVDADHPLRIEEDPETGEPSPYVTVRDGIEARLTRSVYYDLVARGVEEASGGETVYGVWSQEQFFRLGTLD